MTVLKEAKDISDLGVGVAYSLCHDLLLFYISLSSFFEEVAKERVVVELLHQMFII